MPRSKNLKFCLPYWNLLFIALILSGGGFFWYTTYQQQLLSQLDKQLFLTAEHIHFLSGHLGGNKPIKETLCESLADFSTAPSERLHLAIYSVEGALICAPGAVATEDHELFHSSISTTKRARIAIENRHRSYFRSLFYPFSAKQSAFILALKSDMGSTRTRLNIAGTLMFLVGIALLTVFAILQRKLKDRNLTTIKRLTQLMEHTTADTHPPVFKAAPNSSPEAQHLAVSYNELMDRLAESLKRSRQFSADVTHELRTPLTILRGETELALRNGRDKEQLCRVLESNLEEISRMSYLIEDLLLLSKSDLGEIPLKMENLNLSDLVSELHHQAQLLADAKQISVRLQTYGDQIFVHADSLRIRQVLLNLLTNAIKYTPEQGEIKIVLEHDSDSVDISIIDSGIGIKSDHLEKIFERFYRINKTRNRNDGGSGLGLAIVQWIVDAHKGTVKVTSIPGQGSHFTVILPLSKQADE